MQPPNFVTCMARWGEGWEIIMKQYGDTGHKVGTSGETNDDIVNA